MTIQSISEEVRRIQKKYGESDPFRLAQAMKIIVVLKPMGRYKGRARIHPGIKACIRICRGAGRLLK